MKNNATETDYPKTLLIRNTLNGMIWQIYHVNNIHEATILATNARMNAFLGVTLEDYIVDTEESFPDWRESEDGKKLIQSALLKLEQSYIDSIDFDFE